jgi:hypothetical protein
MKFLVRIKTQKELIMHVLDTPSTELKVAYVEGALLSTCATAYEGQGFSLVEQENICTAGSQTDHRVGCQVRNKDLCDKNFTF